MRYDKLCKNVSVDNQAQKIVMQTKMGHAFHSGVLSLKLLLRLLTLFLSE